MTSRGWLLLAMALGVAGAGCSDTKKPTPSDSWGPRAGGINEDIGSRVPCKHEQRVDLAAQTALGFSAQDLLAHIAGRYRLPLTWSDPCEEDRMCSVDKRCAKLTSRPVPSVAGSDTFVALEVRALGSTALAEVPDDQQPECAGSMRVPVEVRIASEDDAFALQVEAEVWSEDKGHAQVLFDDLPTATGTLIDELPEGTRLDLGFGGGEDDYWYFGMYAISSDSEPPLLEGAITGSCVGEGPRSEYLIQ